MPTSFCMPAALVRATRTVRMASRLANVPEVALVLILTILNSFEEVLRLRHHHEWELTGGIGKH